jgi:thioredoxin 1
MGNTLAVTDETFETEIEKASGLAVVDFWAEWCGPCRMVGPIIEQLAGDYQGKAKVAKLDVDANPKTGMRFNVRSIPTILFFKNGKLVDQVIGFTQKAALDAKFRQHSATPPPAG